MGGCSPLRTWELLCIKSLFDSIWASTREQAHAALGLAREVLEALVSA